MKRTLLILFSCVLAFASNLNAQDTEPADQGVAQPQVETQISGLEDALESSSDVVAAEVEQAIEEALTDEAFEGEGFLEDAEDAQAVATDEIPEEDLVEAIDAEANEVDDELEGDEEELEEEPLFVSVNGNGELVGQATAIVSGQPVAIEANISLVQNGVLISKILAQEDGSFAFPNIAPGQYDMFGVASSYCGQQAFTVMPGSDCTVCQESVPIELSQGGGCYRSLGGAPAASCTCAGGGGLGGGGFFSSGGGGGFVSGGGGGGALAGNGLRLLGVGGIVTAIAVGSSDDDDASPSE